MKNNDEMDEMDDMDKSNDYINAWNCNNNKI